MHSPSAMLAFSVIVAIAGTALLMVEGKWLGAAAFGGANAIACVFWVLLRRPFERMVREQSMAEAVVTWVGGVIWAALVVGLYWLDYTLAASLIVGVTGLLYLLGVWMAAYDPKLNGESSDDQDDAGPG